MFASAPDCGSCDNSARARWVASGKRSDRKGDRVAIKFASRHILKDPTDRARFSREATLANQLESPHVVQSEGFGISDEGTPYIVMELLRGETLADRLRRERVIGHADLVRMLQQIASALDEAHALGIIHRDVKPANVYLVKQDEGAPIFAKMLDFGMAKRTRVVNPSVVTEEGTSVGTPDFMSPEQLKSPDKIDHRSDIWAIGVLTYRALIGRLPFVSQTFAGLCTAIAHGKYTKPSELAPNLPPGVDGWFRSVLAIDPDGRYESAGEAVAGLRIALGMRKKTPVRISHTPDERVKERPATRPRDPAARRSATGRGSHKLLNAVIAILLGFTALCVGALLASMDGF